MVEVAMVTMRPRQAVSWTALGEEMNGTGHREQDWRDLLAPTTSIGSLLSLTKKQSKAEFKFWSYQSNKLLAIPTQINSTQTKWHLHLPK
jgi:hypothetical protein